MATAEPSTSHRGYPGPSAVTGRDILSKVFFMSNEEWETARTSKSFDYVIIGSSFCALAFVDRVMQNNPNTKCIILERGDYFHPDHIEHLPSIYMKTYDKGKVQTFPWSLTEETHNNGQWVHGMYNFLGGCSTFWSGWCPEPTNDEMEGWPSEVIKTVQEYFPKAADLLNITPANSKIFDKDSEHAKPIFGVLQDKMDKLLANIPKKIEEVTRVCPAQLAVVQCADRNGGYRKFSVQEKLLHLAHPTHLAHTPPRLRLMIECLVTKINHNGLMATELETNRGTFALGRAKLILAMGSLPPTTLVLNSFPVSEFPLLKNVGKRLTGHIRSLTYARILKDALGMNSTNADCDEIADYERAGNHIAGKNLNSGHQFHIQLSSTPGQEIKDARLRTLDTTCKMKGIVASPSIDQLSSSRNHIAFLCSCVGQLDHRNPNNWVRKNNREDLATNIDLQVVLNENDNGLWDTMDSTTFEVLEKMFDEHNIEYWHKKDKTWKTTRPSNEEIRRHGIVHETSTMWIGSDHEAPVGLDYRLKGVDNVYVTGGSLWPTGASWNPTAVMTALAIHLADQVCSRPTIMSLSAHI